MTSGVQITFIICFTIVAIFWIAGKYFNDDSNNKKKK